MNEEFEVAKAELHSVEEVADIIKNPIVRNVPCCTENTSIG